MTGFQSSSSEQGRLFDQQCRMILRGLGCDVPDKGRTVDELGIEVDAEAVTRGGRTLWFEFKGSWLGPRPGGQRTDTVKKALCNVLLAHVDAHPWPSFVVLTSHLPKQDRSGDRMVKVAKQCGALLDLINVNDINDLERLQKLMEAS